MDREVTRRIAEAGKLLSVQLLDHIVFTTEGRFTSLLRLDKRLFQ